ncbi:nucleoside-diphosphate-sugar epimerase [Catalinimonas alkaloidigena]|uniref:NAD-dependent epimerase/dehydratase family protein n=1 Tax=Catalinimonas alkaloidigena TaxID=1075417 RepID=UPI002407236E|nr:SDR family oxidoreductase [Catalinimonas alkaloidigena]MDF9795753.1 nucleoside-diphosphate-sugar epimerase [Catalinimonas alkaloidigena]
MKIFVSGHNGYIGAHLISLLKAKGHEVTGCDINLYEGCAWEAYEKPDHELIKDVREVQEEDLRGHDAVMHLAALSNDPMGDVDPELTYQINLEGSVRLARLAKSTGVSRFLFASSCSIYGKGAKLDMDENDPVNPLTAYAKSKIESEKRIGAMADENFSPVFLRNATAYGYSPMLRIDLVVNNLLACAVSKGNIAIKSDGSPWRPLIHCKDIAHAFVALAEAPKDKMHNRIINIGANSENYQVRDVADQVQKLLPDAEIVYTGEVGEDPRNYKVNFDLLYSLLPDFKLEYDLQKGMQELFDKLIEHHFSAKDFDGDQFVRLKTLAKRLSLIQ